MEELENENLETENNPLEEIVENVGNELTITWCGDSRAYIFNPKTGLQILSEDHSYVQDLVKKGYERVKFFPNPTEKTAQYLSIIEREVNNH